MKEINEFFGRCFDPEFVPTVLKRKPNHRDLLPYFQSYAQNVFKAEASVRVPRMKSHMQLVRMMGAIGKKVVADIIKNGVWDDAVGHCARRSNMGEWSSEFGSYGPRDFCSGRTQHSLLMVAIDDVKPEIEHVFWERQEIGSSVPINDSSKSGSVSAGQEIGSSVPINDSSKSGSVSAGSASSGEQSFAEWLRDEMQNLPEWSAHSFRKHAYGPDWKTVDRALKGLHVRKTTIDKIVRSLKFGLFAAGVNRIISVDDVPSPSRHTKK